MSGKRPVAPEGFEAGTAPLAVREPQIPSGGSTRSRLLFGVLWSSLGSLLVVLAPVVANVLVAYGAAVGWSGSERRGQVGVLLAALAAGCAGSYVLTGVYGIPMTVVSITCAFALAWSYLSGRLRTSGLLAAAAAATLALLAIDYVSTSMQGTTITALITGVVDQAVASSAASLDIDGRLALLETKNTMVAYWPTMYFVVGLGTVICSLAGTWLGARATGIPIPVRQLTTYDAPLVVAILFAVGVAAQLLGPHLPSWQTETATAGANVVMCTRFALAMQGLSVLLWRLRQRHAGVPARIGTVLAGLWLEAAFALTSVLGLVDLAVNFRHFERKRADLVIGPTRER